VSILYTTYDVRLIQKRIPEPEFNSALSEVEFNSASFSEFCCGILSISRLLRANVKPEEKFDETISPLSEAERDLEETSKIMP
jgi:hypothetical protein